MTTYIIRRVLISILVVFIVSVFSFSLMHLMPGDPALIALGGSHLQDHEEENN